MELCAWLVQLSRWRRTSPCPRRRTTPPAGPCRRRPGHSIPRRADCRRQMRPGRRLRRLPQKNEPQVIPLSLVPLVFTHSPWRMRFISWDSQILYSLVAQSLNLFRQRRRAACHDHERPRLLSWQRSLCANGEDTEVEVAGAFRMRSEAPCENGRGGLRGL